MSSVETYAERLVTMRACPHDGAGPRDHRCPACFGILRRCCLSVGVLAPHAADCRAASVARMAKMAGGEA